MAPETLRGKDTDARSDQFSFSVALYEALYGHHPFDGETALVLIEGGKPAAAPPVDTKVPAAIGRAVLRGLEDVPTKRFPSMAALIAALTPPPVRAPRRIVAAVAVALLAAGAAGAAVISSGGDDTRIPTEERQRYDETIAQLKAALDERNKLIVDLTEKVAKGETTIVELRAQVAVQDEKIEQLIQNLDIEIQRPDRPARPRDGRAVITRLRAARGVLVNCFGEWAERNPGKNTRVRVTASVSPTGVTYGWAAINDDNPSLSTCIMDALKDRVPLPAPGLKLQIAITALYTGGDITVDPEVLTAEEATGGTIDLGTPSDTGKIDL
jgi:serine/threonine protein kinase